MDNYVICIFNDNNTDLILCKVYKVLSFEDEGMYRIIDESGEDYLYPYEWFCPFVLDDNHKHVYAEIDFVNFKMRQNLMDL